MDFHLLAKKISRIEFWVATVIYLMSLIALTSDRETLSNPEYYHAPVIIPFASAFVRELVQFTTIFAAFVLLTLYIVPRLLQRQSIVLNLVYAALIVVAVGVVLGSLDYGVAPMSVFITYSSFKHGLIFLWTRSAAIQSRYRFLTPGVMFTIILWLFGTALFMVGEADLAVIAAWVTIIPLGIVLYAWSFFSLIADAQKNRRPFLSYVWKVILVLAVASIPIFVLSFWITEDDDGAISIALGNAFLQLLFTIPFTWWFYKRQKQGADELVSLQKELGQSTANIDFLRSQINPHFLFNSMNTLYGTAIQEKAERTAEGVQKLGDMMRFMLHENMQPRILLAREIEYLRNYISFQRLRTDMLADVTIHTAIDDAVAPDQIPPMLLIPFVENAFKHGISLRAPSHIGISLTLDKSTLHFDVHNSQHPRVVNDPEKDKSGIGLANVKQRLQLLYPGKYMLNIRETGKEFFVHLTIQL